MESNKINLEETKRKNLIVDNAIVQLKKEFVGIHAQIDEIMNNVRTWYLFPKLQTRPLVVCIWGLSGTGKTSLIKRIAQLLDIEKDLVYFNFASISENSSWEIENQIEEELSNEASNRMFVYDEFQYAATMNPKTGEERETKTGLKPFWELLDSGLIHKRSDFWNVRMPYKVINFIAKINYVHPMEIKDGVWINAKDCLSNFKQYDIMQFKQVFNFDLEQNYKTEEDESQSDRFNRPSIIRPYADNFYQSFFIRDEYLEKIMGLYDHSANKVSDKIELYHRLEKMNIDELFEFICDVYESSRKGYDLKFNDSIIFVIANLDEAYQMSFNVNPDMSPDQFRKVTEDINVVDIKDALKVRFRNEQIARLGNIHVIYPSFSCEDFKKIIEMNLNEYEEETYKLTNYHLEFDESVKQIIYEEGVFPTHGTRPVLSSIYEIVKSKLPGIIRVICENELSKEVKSILYTFDCVSNNIVVFCKNENGDVVCQCNFDIKLRLKNLRDSDITDEEQAICALHESGHFVMYAKLFHKMPEKLVSRTAESSSGGFLMEDYDECKKKVDKQSLINEICVMLGGYVAEKEFFGDDARSTGASKDLAEATMLASKIIRKYGMGTYTHVTAKVSMNDPEGLLVRDDNESQTNTEIKNIITEAENLATQTFRNEEWKKMLKESAVYLCENSSMSKEKMQEIYDKVSESVKGTERSKTFYHDAIFNM